jgi:hypothetical protein
MGMLVEEFTEFELLVATESVLVGAKVGFAMTERCTLGALQPLVEKTVGVLVIATAPLPSPALRSIVADMPCTIT